MTQIMAYYRIGSDGSLRSGHVEIESICEDFDETDADIARAIKIKFGSDAQYDKSQPTRPSLMELWQHRDDVANLNGDNADWF